ncbi:MAG: hypothetical protein ABMA15_14375 [Vicinamibacterales bacterium]
MMRFDVAMHDGRVVMSVSLVHVLRRKHRRHKPCESDDNMRDPAHRRRHMRIMVARLAERQTEAGTDR